MVEFVKSVLRELGESSPSGRIYSAARRDERGASLLIKRAKRAESYA